MRWDMSERRSRSGDAPSSFVRTSPEGWQPEAFWRLAVLLLGTVAGVGFLVQASAQPAGLQDDARMFLSWMGRWDDPGLLRGDLMADYWRSVTPWFFRAIFHAAWWLGIEPMRFVRLLPALLYPLVALFSFRALRAMQATAPIAFLTTAAVLFYFTRDGTIVSGTPRALWPALLLALLDGLARSRARQTALAQLLLSGCYPQLALVSATAIGLTMLSPQSAPFLDLSRRRIALVAWSAVATITGILPFLLDSGSFGPVVTLAEAHRLPTFGAAGRNRIFGPDGSLDFLCDSRLGLFGSKCKEISNLRFPFLVVATLCGPLILLRRAFQGDAGPAIRSVLPAYLLSGSLLWFSASALLLFRLHLPSRYTAALLVVAMLSTLPVLLEWIGRLTLRLAGRRRAGFLSRGGVVALALLAVVGLADARRVVRSPSSPELIASIASLPPNAVVAGFVEDLDFSPVMTNRSTLFSRELAIAYHLGFFRPLMRRMEDMRDAVLSPDPAVLADRLRRNGVDLLLVPDDVLVHPRIPDAFRVFFGDGLAAFELRAGQPTALARVADRCSRGAFVNVRALDAACLIRASTSSDAP